MLDIEKMRSIYRKKDLTQGEFAALVGISQTHLSQIEAGKKTPSLAVVTDIAAALGLPAGEILLNPPTPSSETRSRRKRGRKQRATTPAA